MSSIPLAPCGQQLHTHATPQVLVNAGQANAATGTQGYADCVASAEAVAAAMGVPRDDVLIESTGVIGRRIKVLMAALQCTLPCRAKTEFFAHTCRLEL